MSTPKPSPTGAMNEDLEHLEANLHRIVSVARTLARDADASTGEHWNEPYAYRAALDAISAARNLRSQLEARWLVTPLDAERPQNLPELNPRTKHARGTKTQSYPHVIQPGVEP
ncbi:MAG: hypothetical protein ABIP33_03375 [Pseudolysinimonas sp.]